MKGKGFCAFPSSRRIAKEMVFRTIFLFDLAKKGCYENETYRPCSSVADHFGEG